MSTVTVRTSPARADPPPLKPGSFYRSRTGALYVIGETMAGVGYATIVHCERNEHAVGHVCTVTPVSAQAQGLTPVDVTIEVKL